MRAFGWSLGNLETSRNDLNQCLMGNSFLSCGGADVTTGQEAIAECGNGQKEVSIFAVD